MSTATPTFSRSIDRFNKPAPRQPARPAPKLLIQVRQALRARHYSQRTEDSYVIWIKRYIFFHKLRHPAEMAEAEVNQFLTYLAIKEKVTASTQNQALSALLFLYRYVLERQLGQLGEVIRARKSKRLPVVLTRDEVKAVFSRLRGAERLIAVLMYGTGMRLMECLRLRVKDVDFGSDEILIRQGKGDKDQRTMLPEKVKAPLLKHLERVKQEQKERKLFFGLQGHLAAYGSQVAEPDQLSEQWNQDEIVQRLKHDFDFDLAAFAELDLPIDLYRKLYSGRVDLWHEHQLKRLNDLLQVLAAYGMYDPGNAMLSPADSLRAVRRQVLSITRLRRSGLWLFIATCASFLFALLLLAYAIFP